MATTEPQGPINAPTEQEIQAAATSNALGRYTTLELREMCRVLEVPQTGRKLELIARVHEKVGVAFAESDYPSLRASSARQHRVSGAGAAEAPPVSNQHAQELPNDTGTEGTEKRAARIRAEAEKRVRLWDGSAEEHIKVARKNAEDLRLVAKTLLSKVQARCMTVVQLPPAPNGRFPREAVEELAKHCTDAVRMHAGIRDEIDTLDHVAKILHVTRAKKILSCHVCMDETTERYLCLDPCGHTLCIDCESKLRRKRCPLCSTDYISAIKLYV